MQAPGELPRVTRPTKELADGQLVLVLRLSKRVPVPLAQVTASSCVVSEKLTRGRDGKLVAVNLEVPHERCTPSLERRRRRRVQRE